MWNKSNQIPKEGPIHILIILYDGQAKVETYLCLGSSLQRDYMVTIVLIGVPCIQWYKIIAKGIPKYTAKSTVG